MLSFLALILLSIPAQAGLRAEMRVLQGALHRAGGSGGMNDLDTATLNNLCERGFRKVFYLYPSQKFRNQGTHTCTVNGETRRLDYVGGGFLPKTVKPILVEAARSAENGEGAVLAHCWNGWHASGEVAAYALMQLCNWSGDQAAKYWADNVGDKGNLPKYASIPKRIRSFVPFSDVRISDSAKARVCP